MTLLKTLVTVKGIAASTTLNANTASVGTDATLTAAIVSTDAAPTTDVLKYGAGLAGDAIESTLIKTQATADNLAAYLSSVSTMVPELVTFTIDNDSSTRLDQIRDIDLNDRIVATEAVTGTTVDGFVESIEHIISNAGNKHELKIMVSARQRMIGIYSTSGAPYALSLYSAANPVEPPPYAVYGY